MNLVNFFLIFFFVNIFLCFRIVLTINSSNGNDSINCFDLRDAFSKSTANFTSCAVNNSHPITFCENCIDSYLDVLESHWNLSEYHEEGDSTPCIDKFINLDRLQILTTTYLNNLNLWSEAKCYECFEIVNGSLTRNKSNRTKEFNIRYYALKECINSTSNKTVCTDCMDDYLHLNVYYQSISNVNDKIGVCMDMVDLMNNTWSYWSKTCCKYRQHNETVFLVSAVVILFITIVFYLLTQWFVKRKVPTIIQQPRFVESINNLSTDDQ